MNEATRERMHRRLILSSVSDLMWFISFKPSVETLGYYQNRKRNRSQLPRPRPRAQRPLTTGAGSAHTKITTISTFDLRRRLEAAAAAEYQSRRQFQIRDRQAQKRKTHCRGSRVGCAIVVPLQAIRPFDYRSGQALSITTKQKRNDLFRIRAD